MLPVICPVAPDSGPARRTGCSPGTHVGPGSNEGVFMKALFPIVLMTLLFPLPGAAVAQDPGTPPPPIKSRGTSATATCPSTWRGRRHPRHASVCAGAFANSTCTWSSLPARLRRRRMESTNQKLAPAFSKKPMPSTWPKSTTNPSRGVSRGGRSRTRSSTGDSSSCGTTT
jgi:hypothetical protein